MSLHINISDRNLSRLTPNPKGSPGFLIVATTIALVLLSVVGLTFVTIVQDEASISGVSTEQQKAWNIANTGMNRALKYLGGDGNWSDTPATLYNAVSFGGGTYTVETSNAAVDSITVQSTGSVGNAKEVILRNINIDADPNYPGFLSIDMSDITVAGINFMDMEMTNSMLYGTVTIDKVIISIVEPTALLLEEIRNKPEPDPAGWVLSWSGAVVPGTVVDIDDFTISPGETYELRSKFSGNLDSSHTYLLTLILDDGRAYSASGQEGSP